MEFFTVLSSHGIPVERHASPDTLQSSELVEPALLKLSRGSGREGKGRRTFLHRPGLGNAVLAADGFAGVQGEVEAVEVAAPFVPVHFHALRHVVGPGTASGNVKECPCTEGTGWRT